MCFSPESITNTHRQEASDHYLTFKNIVNTLTHDYQTLLLEASHKNITKAAQIVASGGNVAFPTETVYGLGAGVFHEEAVQNIFRAKGRPSDNPLIVHCAEKQDLVSITDLSPQNFSPFHQEFFDVLFERFCPGPLTFILPKKNVVPDIVTAGLHTVAVRFPKHPVALELIRKTGEPLVAPSANRSGYPSPTTAAHVMHDLEGRIDAVLDGGTCALGIESTVINILANPPHILRPGSITLDKLNTVAEQFGVRFEENSTNGKDKQPPLSPGMKYRHYAPNAQVLIVDSLEEAEAVFVRFSRAKIFTGSAKSLLGKSTLNTTIYALSEQNLYAELRAADDERLEAVIVIYDDVLRQNVALMNRLRKAAEG
ncbi:MAG: threonylcarbamoyl-AMP synthase [Candidatus Kapaibacterium sp.]|nr:MAG: threonylcarbamoyl-AMP synthase [Candidatus Kapabacteria bacterium]